MENFLNAFDPNKNHVAETFTNWGDTLKENFSDRSINQQNTILKGVFSTKQEDKNAGNIALMAPANGALDSGIYDHKPGKPNNFDPVYNPDPKAPGAPISNTNGSNTTYYIIGGSILVLIFLMNRN